jgi:hypothetical protein
MRLGVKLGLAAIAAFASGMVAWACASEGDAPTWALAKPEADFDGNAAMLLPSNDTRVNLLLLLADRRGAVVRNPSAPAEAIPLVLFPWKVMATGASAEAPADADEFGGSRCQTNASGTAAFVAAVNATSSIPPTEKELLIAARQGLGPEAKPVEQYSSDVECSAGRPSLDLTRLTSVDAREFGTYLSAAQSFYAGDLDLAIERFRALSDRQNPWVRETAAYMVARSELNLAIQRSVTDYGSLADRDKRDQPTIAAAGTAFQAYLRAYPDGRYASSARGLMRRVHWLAGNDQALAAEYGQQIAAPRTDGVPSWVALVNEVDNKLALPTNHPQVIRDPVLLAVVDLHRMRQPEDPSAREYCCGPAITKAEIEGQRPLFGRDTELFDYVRAAEAYFVRHQPREVLQLIPDAAHQQRFTYVQFSRQMLRGMALQDLGDRNARAFWLSLFPGAIQPYQRPAVELALAMQDERAGRLDLVFAPNSEVRHPIIRELLLERTAGPDLLRQQASRPGVPKIEREVALYMLLSKELRRGFYRDFLNDVRLVPADATADTYFGGATSYSADWNAEQQRPPLGLFGRGGKLGDVGCPALAATATALAEDPRAIRPRLCLAEFFRLNGFDEFNSWNGFDEPVEGNGLASTKPLFPAGTRYDRLEVYKAIIADAAATADDKAWALNRAIRCYAPTGNNSCGGTEVPLSQRRAWFNRLKASYPQSRWAKDLKVYW